MKKMMFGLFMAVVASSSFAAGDADAGKSKVAVCGACHGEAGNSAAPNFPSLAGQHEKYIIKQLKDMSLPQAEGGRVVPEMTGLVKNLSEQDMADIAAYYSSQSMAGGAADPELVEKGESVFRAGVERKGVAACTGCHGPNGLGVAGAGFPRLAGQHAAYIEKQLKSFRQGADQPLAKGSRVNDGDTSMMRDVAEKLSDLEIKAVAS
ncbi:MAG: cytochrome c4, partial [Sinobacterium sp.]|nr:cytochrome c4 [Sinobacterium sp.]